MRPLNDKPSTCDCCSTEFTYSNTPQELLSIYRTRNMRWLCENCVDYTNKQLESARKIASDIQRNYVTRSLYSRRNSYQTSTYKQLEAYNPTGKLVFKIYTNILFYLIASILLFTTTASIIVLEPSIKGLFLIVLSIGSFLLLTYLFSKKISSLINAVIVDSDRKAQEAIDNVIELSNEEKVPINYENFRDSKDFRVKSHTTDTQAYMNPITGQMTKLDPHKKKSPF